MGLFSGKKKGDKQFESDYDGGSHTVSSDVPQFPVYEPSFGEIKNEVAGYKPEFPAFEDDSTTQPLEVPVRKQPVSPKLKIESEGEDESLTERHSDVASSGKPLFVKIENYKSALTNMEVLRKKIGDAEKVLKDIDKIRVEEERALTQWREDLSKVKEKLMELDEDLFEL